MRWNCMSKALRFLHIIAEHQDCPFFTVFLTIKTLSQNISITRNTAASKIGNSVISLLWQLRCRCNPDKNKFSSLSNTTVVAIFPNLCLWRRNLCSNLGGIDPEKLYRATLSGAFNYCVCNPLHEVSLTCIQVSHTLPIKECLVSKATITKLSTSNSILTRPLNG